MKTSLPAAALIVITVLFPTLGFSEKIPAKNHDFIPQFHNVIFLFDVSDSMTAGYPQNFDHSRLFVARRALAMFNSMMPHIPRWQYDLNTALITFGDCSVPKILSPLGPWSRMKYARFYNWLRKEGYGPYRTAALQDALQLAGQLLGTAVGRTAIVVFTDGGNSGECPQKTVTALKNEYGNKVQVFGVFFGEREVGWRNLYEVCKLSGGYARAWEDVRSKPQMKAFAWDITVREVMFPYPEIFFKADSAELIPSEAIKLESVANFLRAIPQYILQIDGHTTFLGNTRENYKLAKMRARNVKNALVTMYKIHPQRIAIRSFGEELPRYDNFHPDNRYKNNQANLYLKLPLRNYPYDEKRLNTFGVKAVGDIYNTQERNSDTEWAWPDKPVSDATLPLRSGR
jgi:outer membrane protein OmpA-like peptidoglycan-associated protein